MKNSVKIICLAMYVIYAAGCGSSKSIRERQTTTIHETRTVESEYTGPKRRVAVVDFENKTTFGQRQLGTSASDILVTELAKSGKFIMVERDKLKALISEQELGLSGAVDPATAAQMGRVLGVNAIITGSVSQFGVTTGGSDYLITQSKRQTAEAVVDIRVIDTETGQILLADSGKGTATRKSGTVLGLGSRHGYDETLAGEALRAGIVKFTRNIISQINAKPWSCRIAEVDGRTIYLNAGAQSGLNIGTVLAVFRMGREIRDPSTGLVIGRTENKIGELEVKSYFGEDGSIAQMKTGETPGINDLCRIALAPK